MRRFVALCAVGSAWFFPAVSGLLEVARAQVPTCAPEQNPWHASSPRTVASFPSAVIPRADGTVLVCGGDKTVGGATRVCEVYDPDTDTWVTFPTEMPLAIWDPIGLELEDRTVLICQGNNGAAESATDVCFLLDDGGTPTLAADDLWETRSGPHIGGLGQQNYEMSVDPGGHVLMRGGNLGGAVQCRVAVYDLIEDVWTYGDCGGQSYRGNSMVPVLDRNGVVYAAGQRTIPGMSEPPRRFDPTTSAWVDLALPPTRRENGLPVPGSGGGLVVGSGNVQIWDSVLYTRAAERLSGSDVWSVATPWPFFVNLYMSWTALMDPARARSLVWSYSNSVQGLSGSDMMPTGFVTYLGDVDQWGVTCPMSMPATYSDGTSAVLGALPEFWQYQYAHARAPSGRIYFLSHYQYPSYWDQHSKENALRLYWYDPNVADRDDDAVPDCCDNCPDTFNPLQTDSNSNGLGDLCEICGDGALALAPEPRTEVIDLVALRFERSYARLGRTGGELPITLTVKTSTRIDSIAITEAIPAGATLVSAPGSNTFSGTNVAANSTLTIAYTIRLPEAQGFIAGQAEVTVQPLELTEEHFAIPLTLLVFRSEECDDGGTVAGDGCSATCVVEDGWVCSVGQQPPSYVPTTVGCLPRCGDGQRVGDEQCDDGNNVGNDGCGSRTGGAGFDNPNDYYFGVCTDRYPGLSGPEFPDYYCRGCQLEVGWACPTDGQPCHAICGDGLTRGAETCDDGNTAGGGAAADGCGADCRIESGWACPARYDCLRGPNGEPVMDLVGENPYHSPQQLCGGQYFRDACMPICGDGVVAGDELCDDGNNASGDGCAGRTNTLECALAYKAGSLPDGCRGCFAEGGYHCVGSECGTQCGDGFVTSDEVCDDGDTDSGDGCDASCNAESGWFCAHETVCSYGACANRHVFCYPICGDGQVLGDEQCDDHNNQDGDGCNAVPVQGWA